MKKDPENETIKDEKDFEKKTKLVNVKIKMHFKY